MKDNFSAQSKSYAKFRPAYPQALYNYLLTLVHTKQYAWDCGTGNGQVAVQLAKYFDKVYATDISSNQVAQADAHKKIIYTIESAEASSFNNDFFDLITVAQAIHWFNFEAFYAEVTRTLKKGGILAVIGYALVQTFPEADSIIAKFYKEVTGPYWDKERKYIDEHYRTIPFPFDEISTPVFSNTYQWTFEQLTGYIETWSAVQHYKKALNKNPVDLIYKDLENVWKNKKHTVQFPILLRIARVKK